MVCDIVYIPTYLFAIHVYNYSCKYNIIHIHSYVVVVTFYYYVYALLYVAIGQVTGVTLTCELMSLFDHYCTVMWNVSVYVYMHTHVGTIIIC